MTKSEYETGQDPYKVSDNQIVDSNKIETPASYYNFTKSPQIQEQPFHQQLPPQSAIAGSRQKVRIIKGTNRGKKSAGYRETSAKLQRDYSGSRVKGQKGLNHKSRDQRGQTESQLHQRQQGRDTRLQCLMTQVNELQKQIQQLPTSKSQHYVDPYLRLGEASRLNLGIKSKNYTAAPSPPLISSEQQTVIVQQKRLIQDRAQQLLNEFQVEKSQTAELQPDSPRFRKSVEKNADVEAIEEQVQTRNSVQYQMNVITPTSGGVAIVDGNYDGEQTKTVQQSEQEAVCTCKSSSKPIVPEEQESEENFQTVAQQIPNVFMLDNDVPSQSNLPMSQQDVNNKKFVLPPELESQQEEERCQYCGGACRNTPNTSQDKQIPSNRFTKEESNMPSSHTNLTDAAEPQAVNIQANANHCSYCGYGVPSLSSAKNIAKSGHTKLSGESLQLQEQVNFNKPQSSELEKYNQMQERFGKKQLKNKTKSQAEMFNIRSQDMMPNSELISNNKGQKEGIRNKGNLLLTDETVQVDVRIQQQNTCKTLVQSKTNQELLNEEEKQRFGIIGMGVGQRKRYSAKPLLKKRKQSKSAKRKVSPTNDNCNKCNRPKSKSNSKSRSRSAGKNVNRLKPKSQLALKTLEMTDYVDEKDDKNRDIQVHRYCPIHGLRETPTTSMHFRSPPNPVVKPGDYTPHTSQGVANKPHFSGAIVLHESHRPSESQQTESVTVLSKKIRDSISFTTMTKTAHEPLNLHELNEKEQEELSEMLMGELKQIASGNFDLTADPIIVSSRDPTFYDKSASELPEEKGEQRINVLELGAKSVLNNDPADISAQSNIATGLDAQSIHQASAFAAHTEMGSKDVKSVTKAIHQPRDSIAYGSEIEYKHDSIGGIASPAYALKQKADEEALKLLQDQEEEEYDSEDNESQEEEEYEEEEESETTVKNVKQKPMEATLGKSSYCKASTGKLSRKTSFSSFYQIDEAEEARLKQIAFDRFMADQKSKNSEKVNTESQQESEVSQNNKEKKKFKSKIKEEDYKSQDSQKSSESQKSEQSKNSAKVREQTEQKSLIENEEGRDLKSKPQSRQDDENENIQLNEGAAVAFRESLDINASLSIPATGHMGESSTKIENARLDTESQYASEVYGDNQCNCHMPGMNMTENVTMRGQTITEQVTTHGEIEILSSEYNKEQILSRNQSPGKSLAERKEILSNKSQIPQHLMTTYQSQSMFEGTSRQSQDASTCVAFNNQKLYEEAFNIQEPSITLQPQATQPALPPLSQIDQEDQSNILEEQSQERTQTVIIQQNENVVSQSESNENINHQQTILQVQKHGIDQDSIPVEESELNNEKTQHDNQNSNIIITEEHEHTSKTQTNLKNLSNLKSSNSQNQMQKDEEGVTQKTIANSRTFKEVQSQKMLPTGLQSKQISEIEGGNHMATQGIFIPSEKSLHAGELNLEKSESKEPSQPYKEARFKTGFQIHDPMMQSEDHLSIKRLLSGEVSIENLKIQTIDVEANREPFSQFNQEQVFSEKGVQMQQDQVFSDKGVQMQQDQVYSEKGVQMQSDLLSEQQKQKVISQKDQSVQLSNKVQPILVDRSVQGSLQKEEVEKPINEHANEPYQEVLTQTFAQPSSQEQLLNEKFINSIEQSHKTRDFVPFTSSYEGDTKPERPDVTTPDSQKRNIAEQLSKSPESIPQNRNNFRNMTGDELEPIKPEMSDQGAEAYIQAMFAQQQQFYQPIGNDQEFQMPLKLTDQQQSIDALPQQESAGHSQGNNSAPFKESESDSFDRQKQQSYLPINDSMPYQLSGRPANTLSFSTMEKIVTNQEKKTKMQEILDQGRNEEHNKTGQFSQQEMSDVLSNEQQNIKSEDNQAQFGTQSVEIFKKDFDKSVATAEKTEQNEENQAYVTADRRQNIDSSRFIPKTISQEDAIEKELKYPQFSQRGTAPFEKSDNKNQNMMNHYGNERQHENQRIIDVQPPEITKTRQTNEDDKSSVKFLNSKKYVSEAPLNEQPYSISTKTPGAKSQGNINNNASKKIRSENKSKSRRATDAAYFKPNQKSSTTIDIQRTTQTDQMPHQTRNALSSQDLPIIDPEYKRQSHQSQDVGSGTYKKTIQNISGLNAGVFSTGAGKEKRINSRFNHVQNIYDSPKNEYPKLVSATTELGYKVVQPKNSLWNENTELNIKAMLTKRTNKRMQQICEDFDIVMNAEQFQYQNRKKNKYSEAGITPNLMRKQDPLSCSQSQRKRFDSEVDHNARRQKSILANSGAQSLGGPSINVKASGHYMTRQTDAYDSEDDRTPVIFQKLYKYGHNVINEQSEGTTANYQRTMSNFSVQYQNFKEKNQAKSVERRNVLGGGKKKIMRDAMYFRGDETDDNINNLTAPIGMHEIAERSSRAPAMANKDIRTVQTPNMMTNTGVESLSHEADEQSRLLGNTSLVMQKSVGTTNQNTSFQHLQNERQNQNVYKAYSPHTNLVGSYASTNSSVHHQYIAQNQLPQPTNVFTNPTLILTGSKSQAKKLQFYPQKKFSSGRNISRAQSSTKQRKAHGAPYLAKPSHLI